MKTAATRLITSSIKLREKLLDLARAHVGLEDPVGLVAGAEAPAPMTAQEEARHVQECEAYNEQLDKSIYAQAALLLEVVNDVDEAIDMAGLSHGQRLWRHYRMVLITHALLGGIR